MRSLYTGLNPPDSEVVHCPFIRIVPHPPQTEMYERLPHITHLIFTSKTSVDLFFRYLPKTCDLDHKTFFAVGRVTKSYLEKHGIKEVMSPRAETAEGLVELIDSCNLSKPKFLWPHSALSRPVISDSCTPLFEYILYDTISIIPDPLPNLDNFDEIIFTSPSTVEGFVKAYGSLPKDKVLTPIGPITAKALDAKK